MVCIVSAYMMVLGYDFFNNFGFFIGNIVFGG